MPLIWFPYDIQLQPQMACFSVTLYINSEITNFIYRDTMSSIICYGYPWCEVWMDQCCYSEIHYKGLLYLYLMLMTMENMIIWKPSPLINSNTIQYWIGCSSQIFELLIMNTRRWESNPEMLLLDMRMLSLFEQESDDYTSIPHWVIVI